MSKDKHESRIAERVLVIMAHPDDIEFGAAGSVAQWVSAGAEVTYCLVTDGSAGSNDPETDLKQLTEERHSEQYEAAQRVGVTDVRFLGYKDGTLEPSLALRRDLTRIIRDVKPDRVVTQDPTTVFFRDTYVNHPDHRAAGEAAVYATFPSSESRPIFPELLDEGYEPHKVKELYLTIATQVDVVVDITDVMEQKLGALLCHSSQLGEEVVDWIKERNAELGSKYGYEYAEAFRVITLVEDEVQNAQQSDKDSKR